MSRIAKAIATVGVGYSPIAPGTCGAAVAVPIAYALSRTHWGIFAVATLAVCAIGTWAATAADRAWGTHDSGRIVIDEVAGTMVTLLPMGVLDVRTTVIGFVLFRIFDIVKPPPVRAIDRKVGGGLGVMLDDVMAGVYAAAVLYAMVHYGVTPFGG